MRWCILFVCLLLATVLIGCGQTLPATPAAPTTDSPTPGEVTTETILARIKLNVTTPLTSPTQEPYDIHNAIRERLEETGFEIKAEDSNDYDAVLIVELQAEKSGQYAQGGTGTRFMCTVELRGKSGELMLEKSIYGQTPMVITGGSLYSNAIEDFEEHVNFWYLGDLVATKYGLGTEYDILVEGLGNPKVKLVTVIRELGNLNDPRVVDILGEILLGNGEGFIRGEAAIALGNTGGTQAEELLSVALNDEEQFVRDMAEESLKRIRGQ